jgi:hypothetical protein
MLFHIDVSERRGNAMAVRLKHALLVMRGERPQRIYREMYAKVESAAAGANRDE